MNINKNIFDGIKSFLGVTAVVTAFVVPAFAASDGCDDEKNDRIIAELALCSTHVYNIGDVSNPTNESDKQLMRDVVALKTTVMTQQMKKQYDYLDATIRRFKTQLEKAVLTTKLQAAGAGSSNDGSSSGRRGMGNISGDRNIVLSGAENCMLKTSTQTGLECIQNNIRLVLNAVSSNQIGEAKRQLEKDLVFAVSFKAAETDDKTEKIKDPAQCANLVARRDVVNNCAYALNINVIQRTEKLNEKNKPDDKKD